MITIAEAITNDFCGAFTKEEDFRADSAVNRLIADGCLPLGVNEKDPRVKKIIEHIKANINKTREIEL